MHSITYSQSKQNYSSRSELWYRSGLCKQWPNGTYFGLSVRFWLTAAVTSVRKNSISKVSNCHYCHDVIMSQKQFNRPHRPGCYRLLTTLALYYNLFLSRISMSCIQGTILFYQFRESLCLSNAGIVFKRMDISHFLTVW